MELAKLIISIAVLTSSAAIFSWYLYAAHSLPRGGPQQMITDICYLYSLPVNASIESVYGISGEVELSPGLLKSSVAAAPICGSMKQEGAVYVYLLPLSPRQPEMRLEGTVRLKLVRAEDGVLVEGP